LFSISPISVVSVVHPTASSYGFEYASSKSIDPSPANTDPKIIENKIIVQRITFFIIQNNIIKTKMPYSKS
jgi:hypothetical protein